MVFPEHQPCNRCHGRGVVTLKSKGKEPDVISCGCPVGKLVAKQIHFRSIARDIVHG